MDELVTILRHQHVALRREIEAVRASYRTPTAHVVQELHRKLTDAKQLIADHIRLEDEHLYPAIKATHRDPKTAKQIEEARQNAHELSARFSQFVEKYSSLGDAAQRVTFIREFSELLTAIEKRMEFEEKDVYPLY